MTAPHDRTADQFDAWLETASQRDSRPTSPNGATDSAAHDLVTTAHEFHASIRAAEQRAVPAIPANAIWEDVMSSTTAGTIGIPALAPSGADAPPNGPRRPISDSPWPKPGHWAVPAFLVVALMIGILWFYSSFFGSTDPGPTPTSQPGFAFSTPTEEAIDSDLLAPITRADCDVAPLSLEQIGAYQVNPGENVPREYGPIAPVSEAEAVALYEASLTSMACEAFGESGQEQAVLSPRHIHEGRHDSIARNSASVEEYIANNQALAALLLDPNRTDYTAVSSTDNPYYEQATPATIDSWFGNLLLPQDVVQFPDGRMGGPLTWVVPANYDDYRLAGYEENNEPTPTPYEFTVVEYAIFVEHDGQWLLDERFTLCAANCEQWLPHAELIYQSAQLLVHTPTPIVLPGTPVMSPVASPTIATPTDDIDEWLVAPDDIDCGSFGTPDPNSTGFDLGQNTSATIDVDDYLPFGEAPALERRQIAERYLHLFADCPRATTDPGVTDEAFMMPFEYATDEQIAAAQEISAALPIQDYRDYFIVRPALDLSGDDQYQGRTVVLPGDVMQLADGRLGVPTRVHFVSQNSLLEFTNGVEFAPANFTVFARVDGHWLVDEIIHLCIGDCDAFWAELAGDTPLSATPAASPVDSPSIATPSASLQPITPNECTVAGISQDEVSAIIRNAPESPSRTWIPVGPVAPETADQINQADRAWQACDAFGSIGQRTVFQTDHLTTHGPEIQGLEYARTDEAVRLWFERFDQRRDLGDAFTASMEPYLTMTDLVVDSHGTGSDTIPSDQRLSLPVTDTAMLLADGRIALAIVDPFLISSWQQSQAPDSQFPFVYMPVHILAHDSEADAWLVDEVFWLCVGDCDAARDRATEFLEYAGSYGSDLLGTPSTSPVATPSGIDDALLNPGECTVTPLTTDEISALQQDPGSSPDRLYGPTSPVDDTLAVHIAQIDREFLACANEGNWRSMASQRLIHEARATGSYAQTSFANSALAQGMSAEEYITWHRDLSATLLPGTLSDYVVISDRDITTTTGRVVQPHQVVQLADGRIGAPQSAVLPADNDIGGEIPLIVVPLNIYIQESDGNDRWALDESLLLCVGDCDMFYEQMARDLSVLPTTTPSPAALPAATPAEGEFWLEPLAPGDCTVSPVPYVGTGEIITQHVPTRDHIYLPVTDADSSTARQVSQTARAWIACVRYTDDWNLRLQTENLNLEPGNALASWDYVTLSTFPNHVDAYRQLSDQVIDPNPETYWVEAPTDDFWRNNPQMPVTQTILPSQLVTLPDGRVGGPLSWLIPRGSEPIMTDGPFQIIPFVILAPDAGNDGHWLVDELIPLCSGDCEAFWDDPHAAFIEAGVMREGDITPPTPPSTPIATPPDTRTIRSGSNGPTSRGLARRQTSPAPPY